MYSVVSAVKFGEKFRYFHGPWLANLPQINQSKRRLLPGCGVVVNSQRCPSNPQPLLRPRRME
jgi:hypothetical protein